MNPDGSNLQPLDEPGSDELLSREVRDTIEKIIQQWYKKHHGPDSSDGPDLD